MADEVIDLSAPTEDGDKKLEAQNAQFVRDLSHILIPETEEGTDARGPLIVIGPYKLQFKVEAPVNALAHLIEGGLDGMRQYVQLTLESASKADFETVEGKIGVNGLGEILNALGEGYTSFPAQS